MNPLIAQFASEPALVEPSQAQRFESCLAQAVAHPAFAEIAGGRTIVAMGEDGFWPQPDDEWGCFLRPYVVKDGILQIPVKGVLLHNFPYVLGGWATGYEYIWRAFQRGCGDFATGVIQGIALIEDTPGGMVAGCFDAVDKMVALKSSVSVPVRAFAHESAYSAGYAIATVADHIVVSRTGGVGSIGVVTSHLDVSGAMQQAGLKITFIASDPSKVEGNPYEALSDDAKARIQARIDELYAIFVAAVSRSRGLSEDAIRGDLKAYCFTASQATSNGLADSVGTLDDALSAFAGFLDDQSEGDESMTTNTTGSVDQAAHESAVSSARAEGNNAGLAAGATAERTRIGAILGSTEAEGRTELAQHFAFETDMPADAAVAALGKAPKAEAAAPAPAVTAPDAAAATFADAMGGTRNPNVGAEAGSGNGSDQEPDADGSETIALARSIGISGIRPAAAK